MAPRRRNARSAQSDSEDHTLSYTQSRAASVTLGSTISGRVERPRDSI
jgi:hypothetical protein